MSAEELIRGYFRAKDENRPHLLDAVFGDDVRFVVINPSAEIAFPALTEGREAVADVFVRRFNQTYENVYTFAMERPPGRPAEFECDWLVGMTEKETRHARVGCGRYRWLFDDKPSYRVAELTITVHCMLTLPSSQSGPLFDWLQAFDYPYTSATAVRGAVTPAGVEQVVEYFGRCRDFR